MIKSEEAVLIKKQLDKKLLELNVLIKEAQDKGLSVYYEFADIKLEEDSMLFLGIKQTVFIDIV